MKFKEYLREKHPGFLQEVYEENLFRNTLAGLALATGLGGQPAQAQQPVEPVPKVQQFNQSQNNFRVGMVENLKRELVSSSEDGQASGNLAALIWKYSDPKGAAMTPKEFGEIFRSSGAKHNALFGMDKAWKYATNYNPSGVQEFAKIMKSIWAEVK